MATKCGKENATTTKMEIVDARARFFDKRKKNTSYRENDEICQRRASAACILWGIVLGMSGGESARTRGVAQRKTHLYSRQLY